MISTQAAIDERFLAKVDTVDPRKCWLWQAAIQPTGYGAFAPIRTKPGYAHRYSYERVWGPIPKDRVIDHLCRVRHCVNPWHLEAVPQRINVLRGARHTLVCPRGHFKTGWITSRGGYPVRVCVECRNAKERARKARRPRTPAEREAIKAAARARYAEKKAAIGVIRRFQYAQKKATT